MENCRPPSYLCKLVSLLEAERPTELISSQDNNSQKMKKQKIEPFLSNKIIPEINVMCVMCAKSHNRIITALLKWDKQCYLRLTESRKTKYSAVFLRLQTSMSGFITDGSVRAFTIFTSYLMKNTTKLQLCCVSFSSICLGPIWNL